MKRPVIVLGLFVLAVVLTGANSGNQRLFAVGSSYMFSSGQAVVRGTVTAELADGWLMVRRVQDGREILVNTNQAFFAEPGAK